MVPEHIDVRSEARGAHWVAWVAQPPGTAPAGSVIIVGLTKEEAEQRIRDWWSRRPR